MKPLAWRAISGIIIALMLAIVAVSQALGGCSGMIDTAAGSQVPMKCHWAFVAIFFLALAGIVSGAFSMYAKGTEGRRISAAMTLVICIACALVTSPLGIGICAKAEMACHTTAYVTWALLAVAAVLSIVQIAKANPEKLAKPKMKL